MFVLRWRWEREHGGNLEMKKHVVCTGVVVLLSLVVSGCATIFNGTSQGVSISSTPADAKVTIYDAYGQTVLSQQAPCRVRLDRGRGYFSGATYRVVVEKAGYSPAEARVSGRLSGWYLAGNFLFGHLIGWLIIDPLTGGMWALRPKYVNTRLAKKGSWNPRKDAGLVVARRGKAPRDLAPFITPPDR